MDDAEKLAVGAGPYFDEHGRPILRDSWVAFLDLLGTSDRLPGLTTDGLRTAFDLFQSTAPFLRGLDVRGVDAQMLAFTDNVVMGIPLDDDYDRGIGVEDQTRLELALFCVGAYQFFNALQGVALRGGLARGDVFISNSFATGQAILDAYVLESRIAVVPRVALDAEAVTAVLRECGRSSRRRSRRFRALSMPTIERCVLVDDEDDIAFVHYLAAAPTAEVNRATVIAHRDFVRGGIKHTDEAVRRKYEWLAAYHDWWVLNAPNLRVHSSGPGVPPDRFRPLWHPQ